ncbi:MAG: hypothetical protein ACI4PR_05825 [Acutalibacteraceae bacterium]
MKAKVDYWSMSYGGNSYSWTKGKEYNIKITKDSVHVESDISIGDIPLSCCNPDLFYDVFDINLDAEKTI